MRYEPFYPFYGDQPSAPVPQQQYFGAYPFAAPGQYAGPPNEPHPSNNPFARQMPGQPPQGQSSPPQGQVQGQGPPPQGEGPSRIDAYMQTANQFLNTAQQFAPVVQQFAPMVKNLPAMWRLYKGFQSLPSDGGGGAASGATRASGPSSGTQQSVPRIFQPPDY